MTEPHDRQSHRSDIDIAVGVLIAARGVGPSDAFAELADHARSTGTGLIPSARAIIALAQGHPAESAASVAADSRWGRELVPHHAA